MQVHKATSLHWLHFRNQCSVESASTCHIFQRTKLCLQHAIYEAHLHTQAVGVNYKCLIMIDA